MSPYADNIEVRNAKIITKQTRRLNLTLFDKNKVFKKKLILSNKIKETK